MTAQPTDARRHGQRRQRAHRAGRIAEHVAAWWLRARGYRIVATGYRTGLGEIDLIARRGRIVAFVEVKFRATPEAALTAVSRHQQRRVARAAALYMADHPGLAGLDLRFDVVALAPWRRPRHLRGAWILNDCEARWHC